MKGYHWLRFSPRFAAVAISAICIILLFGKALNPGTQEPNPILIWKQRAGLDTYTSQAISDNTSAGLQALQHSSRKRKRKRLKGQRMPKYQPTIKYWPSSNVMAKDGHQEVTVMRPTDLDGYECEESTTLVIGILSKTNAFKRRSVIRQLWMKEALLNGAKVFFVLANTDDTSIQDQLDKESATNQDLVQLSIKESYSNITLKTIAILLWQQKMCPRAKCILKADSDIVLLIDNLFALCNYTIENHISFTLYGRHWNRAVVRSHGSQWYVPPALFKSDIYPVFVTGGGYLMTGDVPGRLLSHIPSIKYVQDFPNEDVLFTGLLATVAGVETANHNGFSILSREVRVCPKGVLDKMPVYFVSHGAADDFIIDGWNLYKLERLKRCPNEKIIWSNGTMPEFNEETARKRKLKFV